MLVIFGGSGFIGTALRTLLDKEGIEYLAPTKQEIDLSDRSAHNLVRSIVKDGDTVIMIASYIRRGGYEYMKSWINILMGETMMSGLRQQNLAHCVYVSSDSVYGNLNGIMNEDTPVAPTTLYGHMHAMRELFFKEIIPKEKLTILRPCAIYGKGDTHNAYGINQFIRSATETGEIELFGQGEEYRSNIHVDDVARIIMQSAVEKKAGIFNVNCGFSYSFKRLADIVSRYIEKPIKILSKPRTEPITNRHVDNTKLWSEFFSPRPVDSGIRDMLESMKVNELV